MYNFVFEAYICHWKYNSPINAVRTGYVLITNLGYVKKYGSIQDYINDKKYKE